MTFSTPTEHRTGFARSLRPAIAGPAWLDATLGSLFRKGDLMPVPLLLLVPWNQPATESPPSNPWEANPWEADPSASPSAGRWDVFGVAEKLSGLTDEISELVGTE